MKKLTLVLLFFMIFGSVINAQSKIQGTIFDETGATLIGASVLVENSNIGTASDADGKFEIEASIGEVLLISYLGYKAQNITVDERIVYSINLSEDLGQLEEVVVVGYGTQKKVNVTGAVQTVEFEEAVNQPVTNSGQLLYGRFSGVQLTQGNGNPGADGSSVVIRGIGTFGGTTPLVVIDNIQYDDLAAFNSLAPSDIESISVLKDASSLSIYGARGANGVIIVNTRRGSVDKFEISYNTYFGTQEATITPKFLGALDYATLINEKFQNENGASFDPRYTDEQIEAIRNGSLPNQFSNTSWADEILTSAPVVNHNLSLSGGNEKSTYRVSLGYLSQDAIIRSKFKNERYNFSFNLNSKLKNWLTLSAVNNTFWRRIQGPTGGQGAFSGDNGIIFSFQRTAPTIPLFYENGEFGIVDGAYFNNNPSLLTQNPLRRGFLGNYNSDVLNMSQRLGLDVKITKNLSIESSGSINLLYNNISDFSPTTELNDFNGNFVTGSELNRLSNSTNFEYTLLNENLIRYKTNFKKIHNLSALAGHSILFNRGDNFAGSLRDFPTDNIEEFNGGGILDAAVTGGAFEQVTQSFFARLNYNYDERYLLEVNLRRDGSSKFGSDFLYGNFPSASIGWRVSQEKFMRNVNWITSLKFRASYGLIGNDRIGNYIFEQTYNPGLDYVIGDNSIVGGVAITSLANPFVRWEETKQVDLGMDLGMFNNQLQIEVGYFRKDNSDLLYTNFPVPSTIGVSNLGARNSASMVNTGIEVLASYRGKLGQARFNIGGNLTWLLNNEITGLGDGGEETITNTNIIRIGEPIRAYYGYQAIGIFQSLEEVANSPTQFGNNNTNAGDIRYADISGPDGVPDGVIDDNDRTVIGNPNPGLLANFNGSFDYKNFDLNFLFQGVFDIDRLLMGNGNLPFADDRSNALEFWKDRWTPENPSNNLPRVGGQNNTITSSFYIQDVSYLRLKNIELGYTVPSKTLEKIGIQKLRVFLGAQNLLTFTGLEFFDPERGTGNQTNRNAPLYRTLTFGLNLKI